jgi:hypothetical protein
LLFSKTIRLPTKLGNVAGIGKTAGAEARQRLTGTGVLHATNTRLQIADRKALEEDFLGGYDRALRPEWLMGRFRPLEDDPDTLLTLTTFCRAGRSGGSPASVSCLGAFAGTGNIRVARISSVQAQRSKTPEVRNS